MTLNWPLMGAYSRGPAAAPRAAKPPHSTQPTPQGHRGLAHRAPAAPRKANRGTAPSRTTRHRSQTPRHAYRTHPVRPSRTPLPGRLLVTTPGHPEHCRRRPCHPLGFSSPWPSDAPPSFPYPVAASDDPPYSPTIATTATPPLLPWHATRVPWTFRLLCCWCPRLHATKPFFLIFLLNLSPNYR